MAGMDLSTNAVFDTIAAVDDFTLDVASDRAATYDTLLYKGRRVTEVEARIVEAQFRLPNGSTLVMLNEDEPFKEMLTLVLVGPGLDVLDRKQLGGAYTPGYLIYAYPIGPDEIAFCWHDLDQVVTVRRYRRWFGLRSGWLRVREVAVQPPRPPSAPVARPLAGTVPAAGLPVHTPRAKRRGRVVPSLIWLAWLTVRTSRFGRKRAGRDRGPRR